MWFFRQSNNFMVICALLLSAGFLLQIKMFYNNHQKNLRIQEVKDTMNELEDNMRAVEAVANKTAIVMKVLDKTVKAHRRKSSRLKRLR